MAAKICTWPKCVAAIPTSGHDSHEVLICAAYMYRPSGDYEMDKLKELALSFGSGLKSDILPKNMNYTTHPFQVNILALFLALIYVTIQPLQLHSNITRRTISCISNTYFAPNYSPRKELAFR
ncbi:hypothetical protein V1527DRAFT_512828 [Lipomyces starkeyi]